ncbi:MAG: FtsQ-type POTRA domain-containing protein [Rhizobiales bacterium]|nr:FtsQ-type POTRA domain-containing protein [Hyphomicrobiales bacterium]
MQSLIRRMTGRPAGVAPTPVIDFTFLDRMITAEKVILPPALRRPMRVLSRLQIKVPVWLRGKGVAGLLAATALYGLIAGGHAESIVGYTTAFVGLSVDEVKITGHIESSEIDIITALDLKDHASLVSFDAAAARKHMLAMPWVKDVTVRKTYPGSVDVAIVERVPFALWQSGQLVSIIDPNGRIIEPLRDSKFSSLLLLVGTDAEKLGPAFVRTLARYETIETQVRAAVFVAGRRWNLVMENGVEIKLPEKNMENALAKLARIHDETNLINRDIISVDLRIPGKMAVRLPETVMKEHKTTFEKRAKELKKGAI